MNYLGGIDKKSIKLLAFDLDGTLLNAESHVSGRTAEALQRAADAGLVLCAATGRVFTSLPEDIAKIPAVRYAITSNGAHTIDLTSGETIYENLLDPDAVRRIMPILRSPELMLEVFFRHQAYMSRADSAHLQDFGINTPQRLAYVRATRIPVDDLFGLLEEHIRELENLKLGFADTEKKYACNALLQTFPGLTVVCSQHFDIEIGGSTTSKADALRHLCGLLGFSAQNAMVFGDSNNDAAMLGCGGVSIAMDNAVPELKALADIVCPANTEDGIAVLIDELLRDR